MVFLHRLHNAVRVSCSFPLQFVQGLTMVFDKTVQALMVEEGMSCWAQVVLWPCHICVQSSNTLSSSPRPQAGVAWGKFSDDIQRTGWCETQDTGTLLEAITWQISVVSSSDFCDYRSIRSITYSQYAHQLQTQIFNTDENSNTFAGCNL